jgi:hypothetical protein
MKPLDDQLAKEEQAPQKEISHEREGHKIERGHDQGWNMGR